MTIREIESRSGMGRANIRFYEREGLLSPARMENGYRDYSESDLALLLRIKLLRSLHISLEEVRRLCRGEEELSQVLDRKIVELERERQEADYARELCRTIQEDRVDFPHLDAQKYLEGIHCSTFVRTGIGQPAEEDALPGIFRPWRRFLARWLDLAICNGIWILVLALVFHINFVARPASLKLLDGIMAYLIMLFIEPLFLRWFGTTPGKALLGLRLESPDGGRLPYFEGLMRTGSVLWRGMGFGIPILNLVRLYKSYRRCKNEELQPWDEEVSYVLLDMRLWRGLAWIAGAAAVIFCSVCAIIAAEIPPHRGELTVAEFAENYNFLLVYYGLSTGQFLDKQGQWQKLKGSANDNSSSRGLPEFTYTLENGIIKGIAFEEEIPYSEEWIILIKNTLQMQLTALAYAGAQEEIGLLSGERSNAAEYISEHIGEKFTYTLGDMELSGRVEYSGYHLVSGMLIADDTADTHRCRVYFQIVPSE